MSFRSRLTQGYASGHLFAHMFESSLENDGLDAGEYPLKKLFEVMAKQPGARYENSYEHEYVSDPDHGIVGLATTAIQKDKPIGLYTAQSDVGLLLDRARPILVSPGDGFTKMLPEGLQFTVKPDIFAQFPSVYKTQGIIDGYAGFLDMSGGAEQFMEQGEAALADYWKCVEKLGFDKLRTLLGKDAMNEVNVTATLKDVCGIIVNKREFGSTRNHAKSLKAAQKLKEHLIERYPQYFDASLPIVTYEMSRSILEPNQSPKMTILEPEQTASAADKPSQPRLPGR